MGGEDTAAAGVPLNCLYTTILFTFYQADFKGFLKLSHFFIILGICFINNQVCLEQFLKLLHIN